MPLIAKEGIEYHPIPEGVYVAGCYAVYDIGTQFSEKFHKSSHQIVLIWEIPELRIEVEKDGRKLDLPRATSKRYSLSLGSKSHLRHHLEAWRGRAFTQAELDGFDLKAIVGAWCQLQIVHERKEDKTYANIAALMGMPKGMPKPVKTENPLVYFCIEDTPEMPENAPEWIQDLIGESEEMRDRPTVEEGAAYPGEVHPAPAAVTEDDNLPF